jgi:hypothetical protein
MCNGLGAARVRAARWIRAREMRRWTSCSRVLGFPLHVRRPPQRRPRRTCHAGGATSGDPPPPGRQGSKLRAPFTIEEHKWQGKDNKMTGGAAAPGGHAGAVDRAEDSRVNGTAVLPTGGGERRKSTRRRDAASRGTGAILRAVLASDTDGELAPVHFVPVESVHRMLHVGLRLHVRERESL